MLVPTSGSSAPFRFPKCERFAHKTGLYAILQMLGVNLGGWLVLEEWMTPDLWAGINGPGWSPYGEYQLMMGAKYLVIARQTASSLWYISTTDASG